MERFKGKRQASFNERICCLLVKDLNMFIVPESSGELVNHDLKLATGRMGKGSDTKE